MRMKRMGWLAMSIIAAACGEKAGTGSAVSIPSVQVDCTSSLCRRNLNPTVIVVFTSSGCSSAMRDAVRIN